VRLFAAIAVAAVAVVLTATSSTAGAAQGVSHQLRFIPRATHASRIAPAPRSTKTTPLNCVSACSLYESTINQYFTDVAHDNGMTTNVYSVATQYSSIQYNETFAGSYVDGNPYPTGTHNCHDGFDTYCVTDLQLETEIGKVIKAKGWPTHLQNPNAVYFIFTPANVGVCGESGTPSNANPCTTNVFCAYHSATSSNIIYAVEPDAAAVSGGACNPDEAPAGNGADATLNTVSHEHNEAITDPFGNGWISNDGLHGNPENGDLCAYDFGTPLGGSTGTLYNQVINSHHYYLQLEYSNEANGSAQTGCMPYRGGPVTPANPLNGSGPLVFQGGSPGVMTTNTVYAIYWVPAPPANISLPTISGIAKVGRKLTESHGTWSNTPKFTYKWLRCSSTGTLCKGISMATGTSYVLVAADKGHKIEVRVTATNVMGSATKLSAPTAIVTK
jgi:hypothetical protein